MSYGRIVFRLSHIKEKKIKLAAHCMCENCGNKFPLLFLEIHANPVTGRGMPVYPDESSLLVLCTACHRSLDSHESHRMLHARLAGLRSNIVRKEIQAICESSPRQYHPPDSPPFEQLFKEAVNGNGIDIFQNGA